jgi:hypothetical protein
VHITNWLAQVKMLQAIQQQSYKRLTDISALLRKYERYRVYVLNLARILGIHDAEIALRRCEDFAAVRQLHDRWTDMLNGGCK